MHNWNLGSHKSTYSKLNIVYGKCLISESIGILDAFYRIKIHGILTIWTKKVFPNSKIIAEMLIFVAAHH